MTLTLADDTAQPSPQLSRYEDMSIEGYEVVHLTQHWRIYDDTFYRDAWVRTRDGLRLVAIRDDLIVGAL